MQVRTSIYVDVGTLWSPVRYHITKLGTEVLFDIFKCRMYYRISNLSTFIMSVMS